MNNKIIIILTIFSVFKVLAQPNSQNTPVDDDALQLNTITTSVPFLQITPDSRSGAMGDAGTALSASSASLFWNTSMLSFSEENNEIGISYSPWLSSLANDISLSYLSGYKKIDNRNTIGGSLRYFSLGEIVFTDDQGDVTRNHTPTEFEILGGYAFKLNERFALGVNGKFVFSNLTAGISVGGAETKAGIGGAADVSFTYYNPEVNYGGTRGKYAFGMTVNNIGNKISYTSLEDRDFMPTNLEIGNALTFDFDKYNSLTWNTDISKLLVPTPAYYEVIDGETKLVSGKDPNVGVIAGVLQSFYDAPGVPTRDNTDNLIMNADGSYEIVSGSRFKEELSEIMIGTGLEYAYKDIFSVRTGYFYENRNKGARQHLTFGVGLKYNVFLIDFSYLTALGTINNPLNNTLRFSLRFQFGNNSSNTDNVKPE
ncbi:MAG: type IX secretion system outer membrane channel protein PorV [Lishizhenia sp.]